MPDMLTSMMKAAEELEAVNGSPVAARRKFLEYAGKLVHERASEHNIGMTVQLLEIVINGMVTGGPLTLAMLTQEEAAKVGQ